jgi:CubicO group peptidase (beta-lactamase class C family)
MSHFAIDRRRFLVASAGAGAAAVLLTGGEQAGAAVPTMQTYQDLSLSAHEAKVTELAGAGYRPLSVSIYGTATTPQFAAVWVQRSGPPFVTRANLDVPGLQAFYDYVSAFNYRITALSATGSPSAPRFAVVAEESSSRSTLRHSLTRWAGWTPTQPNPPVGTYEHAINDARFWNQIPRALAIYGTADDPRWALVVEPNDAKVRWNTDGTNESATQYAARLTAQGEQRGRPTVLAVSPAPRLFSCFRNNELSGGSVSRHNLTASAYQTEIATQKSQGRYPITMDAGGSGSARRFAAVFVPSETVVGRTTSKRGPDRSAAVDAVMEQMMVDHNVRHATLAVTEGKRLLYARAFTYAEAGFPVATPTSYFRMASCGKTLTAMLILRLIQEGRTVPGVGPLTLGTRLQSVLNLRTPSGGAPADARFGNITIEHLLRHQGGINNPDLWAVRDAYRIDFPVTNAQLLSYAASQPLAFTPGSQSAYSNIGFIMLGAVGARLLGVSYIEALRSRVLGPLGAKVRSGTTLPEAQPADEARYDSTHLNVGWTVASPGGRIVPVVYGADFHHEIADSVSLPAPDFAKVLASFSVRTGNPVLDATRLDLMLNNAFGFDGVSTGPRRGWKGGAMWGQGSTIHVVENGVSYVVCLGQNDVPGGFYSDFPALRSAVAATTWPAGDLFPTFGIPSFP